MNRLQRMAAIAVTCSAIVCAQNPASEPRAIVRIVLNAAYQDDEEQVKAIRFLATRIKPTAIQVPTNDTISATVARVYGFGSKNLDQVYQAFEDAIKDLNGLSRATQWKPGVRLVPTLPSWAKTSFNPDKPQNTLPVFSSASVQTLSTPDGVLNAITAPPPAPRRDQHAPQTVALDLEMSSAEADDLLKLGPEDAPNLLLQPPVLLSAAMPVVFADNGPVASLPPFSVNPQSAESIRRAADRVRRRSLLFILDSGWPTLDIKRQSQRDLLDILRVMRETYALGPALAQSPDSSWSPPANDHCKLIHASLEALQGLDNGRAVQTIYVPLSRDQGAQLVLKELLYVYFVWQGLQQQGVTPGQINLAQRDWRDVRRTAAATATKAITTNVPLTAQGSSLASDKAIVEALLVLATQYSQHTQRAFFISESWTVGKSFLYVNYPKEPRGIVFAAVGNNNGINVYQNAWDFAQRSLQASDHVAVMNAFVGDKPACDSNIVDDFANTRAVAFNGQIDGGPCGTSYAAPRIAWFVAFSEALQPAPTAPRNWANEVQLRLTSWRQSGAGLLKYSFDIEKFVGSL